MFASRSILFAVISVSLLVVAGLVFFFYPSAKTIPMEKPVSQVVIGNTTVNVEVEATDASREEGLSGRTSLAPGSGMLFVFQTPGTYGFWMKDMNFDLDMIFANANGTIVTIAHDVTAASYHENPPQVFYPSAPISYVLEVPAGFAASNNIEEGMTLQLK